MQAQAQNNSTHTSGVSVSQSTDVLIITRTLLAAPASEKNIPTQALKNGKVEFSTRRYYARKILKTEGDLHLVAGDKKDFRAGEAILLEPGFRVDSTAEFTAEIAPAAAETESLAAIEQKADTLLAESTGYHTSSMTEVKESIESVEVSSFTLFPNPVSERLYIRYRLAEEAPVAVSLLTITGAVVLQTLRAAETQPAGSYELAFSINDIPAGMYLVSLKTGKISYTQRVIVQ